MHIDFIELPGPDLAAMKAFYGAAFGWTFKDWGEDYVDLVGAGLRGGFNPYRQPAPEGGALVILYADDLDAAERAVTNAGGEITAKHDFPGGKRFQFRDPCGNELGVWTQA